MLSVFLTKRLVEGALISLIALALFVCISLLSYSPRDLAILHTANSLASVVNSGGRVGAYLAFGSYWLFGYVAFLLPVGLIFLAGQLLREHRLMSIIHKPLLALRAAGLGCFLLALCGLFSLTMASGAIASSFSAGGLCGQTIAVMLYRALNIEGAAVVLFAFFLIGVNWLTGLSWINVVEWIGYVTVFACNSLMKALLHVKQWVKRALQTINGLRKPSLPSLVRSVKPTAPKIKPKLPSVVSPPKEAKPVKFNTEMHQASEPLSGTLPTLGLLDKPRLNPLVTGYTHQELETLSRNVEQHLTDFGIQADVVSVHPGPVITRFELQLAAGVKVSRLTALAKDLARSLSVTSVRIVEIIPGKTVVGIELPNQNRAMVCLEEVLSADVYQQALSPLTLALGVDIAGHPMVVDLAKMPHLLVAGTTGSGKSVGINAMILSLLFKATPDQVRLIMIDPKMLELSVYDGIPHLLTPVVTDMKEAASALRWCVAEMERRYKLMASLGVRNLAGYNLKVTDAKAQGTPLMDPFWKASDSATLEAGILEPLPYVVVIIDELADMMMVVGKKVEQLIARIAQKARAAGIHLILATQRPSVDVLTGLIKSNIPTRISFQVSSKIDSRTILDQQGAEQLLGHGDMLFLAPGTGSPLRVHGAFVDDKEVHRIADDWRARGVPQYIEDITQQQGDGSEMGLGDDTAGATKESDPLYDQAVEFVMQTRKASVSAVQRRFKIGYNRAARLVEEMERTGLVGPLEGGLRDILVSSMVED